MIQSRRIDPLLRRAQEHEDSVARDLAERQRRPLLQSQLLRVDGHLESASGVRHLIAGRLSDLTPLLTGLDVRSRDFQ